MPAVVCRLCWCASLPAYREEPDILRVKCLLEPASRALAPIYTYASSSPCMCVCVCVERAWDRVGMRVFRTRRENRISEAQVYVSDKVKTLSLYGNGMD